jgi:hypothetical protein
MIVKWIRDIIKADAAQSSAHRAIREREVGLCQAACQAKVCLANGPLDEQLTRVKVRGCRGDEAGEAVRCCTKLLNHIHMFTAVQDDPRKNEDLR